MIERRCECVRTYRIAALSIASVLLLALVALLLNADFSRTPSPTTVEATSTAPPTVGPSSDSLNDGLISAAERAAIPALSQLSPANLVTLSTVVCVAVERSADKAVLYATVHTRLLRTRPNMTAGTAARITDAVARVACLDAFEALG